MYRNYIKRVLDILISGTSLIVFSPLLAVLAILVRIYLGTPILFRQNRPGKNEMIFTLCKFRTMTDARDENGNWLCDEKRTPTFGKFLRRSSLDELPELWNIFKGEMSLVGPRPLLEKYLPYYTEQERQRHDVRPGLTGLAQTNGRNTLEWNERLKADVWYVQNLTFGLDLRIIIYTIWAVLGRKNVKMRQENVMLDFDEERKLRA